MQGRDLARKLTEKLLDDHPIAKVRLAAFSGNHRLRATGWVAILWAMPMLNDSRKEGIP